MRLPPNCVKFFTAIKEIDEEEFWDGVYKDMKKAQRYSCNAIDDDFASGNWDKFLDEKKRYFLDGSGWDFLLGIANRKPQIKALLKAQVDPTDTENDYPVDDYLGDNPDWDRDYFDDLFDRLSNNQKIETEFKDFVSDWGYDCRTEYSKYASRKVTASDRSALIRLASTMPVGSPERKAILAGLQGSSSKTAAGDIIAILEREMRKFGLVRMRDPVNSGTLKSGPHKFKQPLVWTFKTPYVSANKRKKFNLEIQTVLDDTFQYQAVQTIFIPNPAKDRFIDKGGKSKIKPLPGLEFGTQDISGIRKVMAKLVEIGTREVEIALESYDVDAESRPMNRGNLDSENFDDYMDAYMNEGLDDDDLFKW
jgi:hypothetical protein